MFEEIAHEYPTVMIVGLLNHHLDDNCPGFRAENIFATLFRLYKFLDGLGTQHGVSVSVDGNALFLTNLYYCGLVPMFSLYLASNGPKAVVHMPAFLVPVQA